MASKKKNTSKKSKEEIDKEEEELRTLASIARHYLFYL